MALKKIFRPFLLPETAARVRSPGEMHTPCPRCNGTGYEPCGRCDDVGDIPCADCGGVGRRLSLIVDGEAADQMEDVECSTCHGTGRVTCPSCLGGAVKRICARCKGAGVLITLRQGASS